MPSSRNKRRKRPRRGFLVTELVIGIALTIVLLAVFAASTLHYAAARKQNDVRRTLRMAAAAELERIRAGIVEIVPGEVTGTSAATPGEIGLVTTTTTGQGDWSGLTRVQVVASKRMVGGRLLKVALVTYVAGGAAP